MKVLEWLLKHARKSWGLTFGLVGIVIFAQHVTMCIGANHKHKHELGLCSSPEASDKCDVKNHGQRYKLICSGGVVDSMKQKGEYFLNITLCHWPHVAFDPKAELKHFQNVIDFKLIKSRVTNITDDFPDSLKSLRVLNMSYLEIEVLFPTVFRNLLSLQILDLRHNKLTRFTTDYVFGLSNLNSLYLAGRSWLCDRHFLWMFTEEHKNIKENIIDVDYMHCGGTKFNGKPLKIVMSLLNDLEYQCYNMFPNNCFCSLDHVIKTSTYIRPMVTVNCSHRGLQKMPEYLPNYTSTLMLEGNQINDVSPLVTSACYSYLLNLKLDDNNISSIDVLEGSNWMLSFQSFSLRRNLLSEVPIHMMENSFSKNRNIARIYLGQNPWKCDCTFTPLFKDFLAKYASLIRDIQQVRCAHSDNSDISFKMIQNLSRGIVCHETKFPLSFLDYFNIFLTVMLVLVLLNFIHNYVMYKKYGKLPWIVTKLP